MTYGIDNDRGSTAVDFALVAPVVFMMILGGIEISVSMFLSNALERGVVEASRFSLTGSSPTGVTRKERVLQILQGYTYGLAEIAEEDIETLIYPSFEDIGKPEPLADANGNGSWDEGETFTDINGNGVWDSDMGEAGLGGPNDVVVYRVNYTWGFLTDLLKPIIGDMTLTGSIAVKNEPY